MVQNIFKALLIVSLVCLLLTSVTVFAQNLQETYAKKMHEANEVRAKMAASGINKETYDNLNTQYLKLEAEIKEIRSKLESDAEFVKRQNDAKLAYNEANNNFKKGQFDAALASYDKAIALDPNKSQAFYGKGLTLARLRNNDEALVAYQKALAIDPSNEQAYSAMGSLYNSIGKYNEAIEAYKKAVDLNQTRYTTIYNLGLVYSQIKDFKNAINTFRMATQVKPDYYKAFISLGVAYMENGQIDQAIMAFESALGIKGDLDEAHYRLAVAFNKAGQYQDALKSAQEALKTTRRYRAAVSFEAGYASKNLGNRDQALSFFEEAGKDRQWRASAEYEINLIKTGK